MNKKEIQNFLSLAIPMAVYGSNSLYYMSDVLFLNKGVELKNKIYKLLPVNAILKYKNPQLKMMDKDTFVPAGFKEVDLIEFEALAKVLEKI